ncbi:hypothetical protein C9374_004857 [Naegleria lovaniensis]|uniref:Uncharacterized protein n=1 Tax=Naegleria lovaniensis TaxID=51637 RepID=A0AA88GRR9_NAELO|nr:uncharacterized protein C9374_004857 [Naegleria lovaniensis]KAG2382890.1 hypothetical protein C9374_004857 [Naegleria lovaniensis]
MKYGLVALVESSSTNDNHCRTYILCYYDECAKKMKVLCNLSEQISKALPSADEMFNIKSIHHLTFSKFKTQCLCGLFCDNNHRLFKFEISDTGDMTPLETLRLLDDGLNTSKQCAISSISAGAYHFIILDENGTVYCYGNNSYSQCGITTYSTDGKIDFPRVLDRPHFLEILKDDVKIVKACCGASHTLLLSDDGCGYALGSNLEGQCGIIITGEQHRICTEPSLIESDVTELIQLEENIVDICCGVDYSIVLARDEQHCQALFTGKRSSQHKVIGFSKVSALEHVFKACPHLKLRCSSIGKHYFLYNNNTRA